MSDLSPDAAPRASFALDGEEVEFSAGDSILAAATHAGRYIPHLCWKPGFAPHGSCRLCTVKVNGRSCAACTTAAMPEQEVQSATEDLNAQRKTLLQMLFVEGNHFCPSCEKSGNCVLQATAYEVGMHGPHFEELYPQRAVDASHPDVLLDLNRCILCGLCVRASSSVDGKQVFAIDGHGIDTRLIVNSPSGLLGDSALQATDCAAQICPVGAILPKRRGFVTPIGQRRFDRQPISGQVEGDTP